MKVFNYQEVAGRISIPEVLHDLQCTLAGAARSKISVVVRKDNITIVSEEEYPEYNFHEALDVLLDSDETKHMQPIAYALLDMLLNTTEPGYNKPSIVVYEEDGFRITMQRVLQAQVEAVWAGVKVKTSLGVLRGNNILK